MGGGRWITEKMGGRDAPPPPQGVFGTLPYSCEKCKNKASVKRCAQCGHKTTCNECLKRHIESIHKNVNYLCIKCEYKVTLMTNLKQHVESTHGNISYPCDLCEYKVTRKQNLNSILNLFMEISNISAIFLNIRQSGREI